MSFRKLGALAAFIPVAMSLSACGPMKQHVSSQPVLKKHYRGEVPFTSVYWGDCLVSVIPIGGDAKYIIQFPNTVKKLQFVNVYESPKNLYLALRKFPFVHGECWPTTPDNPAPAAQQTRRAHRRQFRVRIPHGRGASVQGSRSSNHRLVWAATPFWTAESRSALSGKWPHPAAATRSS